MTWNRIKMADHGQIGGVTQSENYEEWSTPQEGLILVGDGPIGHRIRQEMCPLWLLSKVSTP